MSELGFAGSVRDDEHASRIGNTNDIRRRAPASEGWSVAYVLGSWGGWRQS